MNSLLEKLGPKQRKGSKPRCHWLTHGDPHAVAARLTGLITPWGRIEADDHWMPEGFARTDEAQLHDAPRLVPKHIGSQLRDWWLAGPSTRSRTPNLDIASSCHVTVDGTSKAGLMLIEAKAHNEELTKEESGKLLRFSASANSRLNHAEIGACIQAASLALTSQTGHRWKISRDQNYQMSNRFAWAWKLTELGFPVILVYLGFLNASEMEKGNKQRPLSDHAEWEQMVKAHSERLFPETVWNNRWTLNEQPFIPLIRSLEIRYDRAIEEAEA